MTRRTIGEEFVQKSIVEWLSRNGWGSFRIAGLGEKGVDIKAKNNKVGRFYFIETKGSSSPEVDFVYSLGQIVTRMKDSGSTRNYYALGLPHTSAAIALRRVPYQVAKKLLLHIFSVDQKGQVKRYMPKDIEKLQVGNKKTANKRIVHDP